MGIGARVWYSSPEGSIRRSSSDRSAPSAAAFPIPRQNEAMMLDARKRRYQVPDWSEIRCRFPPKSPAAFDRNQVPVCSDFCSG
jgi:hypothetical protein